MRSIGDQELHAWVECLSVAFHGRHSTAEEVAYRRDVLAQDLSRTLAAVDDGRVVGTLHSFTAELTLPGGTCLTADAISAASVLPSHRRQGLLRRMLTSDLRAARERGEVASILVAAEYPIYGRFGYGPAVERAELTLETKAATFIVARSEDRERLATTAATASSREPGGRVRLVEPARLQQVAPALFDQFRKTRPGQIDRDAAGWETRLGLREAPWTGRDKPKRCAVYAASDGETEGYAVYTVEPSWERHVPHATLAIDELIALSPEAYQALWRYCADVDLIGQVRASMRPADEPLGWLLDNPRAALQTVRTDFLWVRPLDVPRMLAARRYSRQGRLVVEIDDPLGTSGGRFALDGGPDGATCRPTDNNADLSMPIGTLGAISLGGQSVHLLAAAGRIDEHSAGAVAHAEQMFRSPITPWCSTFF